MHDIYDPPPAPEQDFDSAQERALDLHDGRSALPGRSVCSPVRASRSPSGYEPTLALATAAAGSLVIMESWLTALGYLHRCSPLRLKARWIIFLAALIPWLLGLGVVVTLMISLFWISDMVG